MSVTSPSGSRVDMRGRRWIRIDLDRYPKKDTQRQKYAMNRLAHAAAIKCFDLGHQGSIIAGGNSDIWFITVPVKDRDEVLQAAYELESGHEAKARAYELANGHASCIYCDQLVPV